MSRNRRLVLDALHYHGGRATVKEIVSYVIQRKRLLFPYGTVYGVLYAMEFDNQVIGVKEEYNSKMTYVYYSLSEA